ncbi:MAG: DUF4397 domain-containing protein [Pseudomonadota bacterium]
MLPSHFLVVSKRLAFLSLLSFAFACSDSDDDPVTPEIIVQPAAMSKVRVIHASPDAPAVNVSLSGTEAIAALDFGQSSGFADVEAGDYDITVDGILPGDTTTTVITVNAFNLPEDGRTTIVAAGDVATIAPLVVDESASDPAADQVSIAVLHAAPAAPAVDLFVTDPTTDITGMMPLTTLAFQESADAGALTAGDVRIRAVVSGGVVYDSGTVDLTPFAGQRLFIAAIASTNEAENAASPIKLLVSTDDAALVLLDSATTVSAKVVHASPDATNAAGGPVEVFATSAALGADPVELIATFAYTDAFPAADAYAQVPAGDYVFDVAPDSDTIGDSVFQSDTLALTAGSEFTVVAFGRVASTPAFNLLVTEDNNRSVATEARVKVIHAAPAAGTVNVYVTVAGETSVADIEGGTVTPLLENFEVGVITDYVSVAPGDYDVRVEAGGMVAINAEGVPLAGGDVVNVIARGPQEPSGTPNDFGLVLTTN